MSYVRDNLGDGEVVEYMAKLHWIILVQPSIVLLFGVLLTREPAPIQAAGFAIGSLGFWWLMYSLAKYLQSEFVITNSRILIKFRYWRTKFLDMSFPEIESITVDQDAHGRLWKYGTLIISGVGGVSHSFKYISNPLEFKDGVETHIGKELDNSA